jgi:hypothetical protein
MTKIEIIKVEEQSDSLLTPKRFKVGNNTIQTPFKPIDFNDSPGINRLKNIRLVHVGDNPIIERSKFVNLDTYENAINDSSVGYLKESYQYLRNIPIFKEKILLNTITFTFNPLSIKKSYDKLSSFLNIYYDRSDFLFIPNVKIISYIDKKKHQIMSYDEYINYIDSAYENLSFKNRKPIFVPISLKLGVLQCQEMFKKFLDMGYRKFWFDFEGSGSLAFAANIRSFHKIIDKPGLIDEVIFYATNIRREKNPHPPDDSCGASDILSAPLGVDFVGVNRSPKRRGGGDIPPPQNVLVEHKARFLDRSTYNYVKYCKSQNKNAIYSEYQINDNLIWNYPKFLSNYTNSFELNKEFDIQRDIVRSDESVIEYLGQKEAVQPEDLKQFVKIISGKSKGENANLDDWM